MIENVLGGPQPTLRQTLWQIHWLFVLMLIAVWLGYRLAMREVGVA